MADVYIILRLRPFRISFGGLVKIVILSVYIFLVFKQKLAIESIRLPLLVLLRISVASITVSMSVAIRNMSEFAVERVFLRALESHVRPTSLQRYND